VEITLTELVTNFAYAYAGALGGAALYLLVPAAISAVLGLFTKRAQCAPCAKPIYRKVGAEWQHVGRAYYCDRYIETGVLFGTGATPAR
jgi:hypothetical protein